MSHSTSIGASKRASTTRTHEKDELPRSAEGGPKIRSQRSKAKETSWSHLSADGRKTKPTRRKDVRRQLHDTAQGALDLVEREHDARMLEPQMASIVTSLVNSANQLLSKSSGKNVMEAIRREIGMFLSVCDGNRASGNFEKLARNCARFATRLGNL